MTIDPLCPTCGSSYPTADRLKRHQRRVHATTSPPSLPSPRLGEGQGEGLAPDPVLASTQASHDRQAAQRDAYETQLDYALERLFAAISQYATGLTSWDTVLACLDLAARARAERRQALAPVIHTAPDPVPAPVIHRE